MAQRKRRDMLPGIKHCSTLHDMTLTNISLLSFKTPILGLVLMTAYVAVSVYPTHSSSPLCIRRQRHIWALVYFGVFSGRHPNINYKHNIRHHAGLVDELHRSFSHCDRGCLGLWKSFILPACQADLDHPCPGHKLRKSETKH
jgi:hypothetical protein